MIRKQPEYKKWQRNTRLKWKLRGYIVQAEYWMMGYMFPIFLVLLLVDHWFALAFYATMLLYHVSGNIRGLTLHLERLIEKLERSAP